MTWTWRQVHARRLAAGRLLEPARDAVEAASAVCGAHAQILSAAELSLSARVGGLTLRGLRADLWERRRLVKTWLHRGTLHLVPADELPLWVAAVRAGREPEEPELVAAVAAALARGAPLTRDELAAALGDERLRSPWGDVLGPAARAGRLVFGPSRGATPTFVLPDRLAEPPAAEAQREALRRYLRAYGPARHGDFATWLGIAPAEAKALFEAAVDELEPVRVEGARAFALAEGGPPEPARDSVRLLPQYDCYVVGARFGREQVIPAAVKERSRAHGRGRFEGVIAIPTVLADGVVAGFWKRDRRTLTVELLGRVPKGAIRREADRIRAFLDADLALEYGPVF